MNENEQQYRVRWLSPRGVPVESKAISLDLAKITLSIWRAVLPDQEVWIDPPPPDEEPPPREEWSPMLAAGDLQYSLYADGTFEIRDSDTLYTRLTAAETTALLAWLDARPGEDQQTACAPPEEDTNL